MTSFILIRENILLGDCFVFWLILNTRIFWHMATNDVILCCQYKFTKKFQNCLSTTPLFQYHIGVKNSSTSSSVFLLRTSTHRYPGSINEHASNKIRNKRKTIIHKTNATHKHSRRNCSIE